MEMPWHWAFNGRTISRVAETWNFDTKTSSWVKTPSNIRKLGGASLLIALRQCLCVSQQRALLLCVRGFRGSLRVKFCTDREVGVLVTRFRKVTSCNNRIKRILCIYVFQRCLVKWCQCILINLGEYAGGAPDSVHHVRIKSSFQAGISYIY